MKIAVVGGGISGLAAARAIDRQHDVTVFEKDAHVGGHANTIEVEEGERRLGLDTGFLVYNERTYPRFTALLRELGVATQASEMSFSVQCRRCAVAYSSGSVGGVFARGVHCLRPTFLRMLLDIVRFNRAGRQALVMAQTAGTLGDFLRRQGASPAFIRHYITPMAGAIWSSSAGGVERFALAPFLQFFDNHGLLRITRQPQWRTITGGSRVYVAALTRPFAHRVRLRCPVDHIRRGADGVELQCANGSRERFDKVIIAAHADQALALLADPNDAERACLTALRYQRNDAVLHTDTSLLPANRAAWAAWNHHMADCRDSERPVSMTYYLNRLQRLESEQSYCVTLNDDGRIAPERVLARISYEHPVYTLATAAAQARLAALNGERHTFYCGAYLGHGFHEDGLTAGLAVAHRLAQTPHRLPAPIPPGRSDVRAIELWQ